jgi:uncharacterized protein (TIGR00730 family)
MPMKRITVFCGASSGTDPIYTEQARELGRVLAQNNIGLVYGAARIGVMGAVADATLAAGGEAIGVIPHFLRSKEVAHEALTELILVDTMHERKAKMNELCDAVIALPGGFGTLEELFEMLTWAQLGLHRKPIGLLNTNGYYGDLIAMIDSMVAKGFLNEMNRGMLLVSNDINELLELLKNYDAPLVPKWVSDETT